MPEDSARHAFANMQTSKAHSQKYYSDIKAVHYQLRCTNTVISHRNEQIVCFSPFYFSNNWYIILMRALIVCLQGDTIQIWTTLFLCPVGRTFVIVGQYLDAISGLISTETTSFVLHPQVECKKAQPKEVMFPPGTRGRARGLPYTMDAFMLGMGMLSKCHLNFLLTIIHTLTLSITAVIWSLTGVLISNQHETAFSPFYFCNAA